MRVLVLGFLVGGCTSHAGGLDAGPGSGSGNTSMVDRFAGTWTGQGTYRIVCTGACSAPSVPCNASLPCSNFQTCNANGQCQGPMDTGLRSTGIDELFEVVDGELFWAVRPDCKLHFDVTATTATITPGARCELSPCAGGEPSYFSWERATLSLNGAWSDIHTQVSCGGGAVGGNDSRGTFSGTLTVQPPL